VNPPDSELIARVLGADDRGAFGDLVVRHQSSVRRFLRHLLDGDTATADDLAQETFIRAYRGLGQFRGDASFSTWLLGIAHNQFRNARRRRCEVAWEPAEIPDEAEPGTARTADLKADLGAAMKRLDPDEQAALHLFYHQGLTHPDIASITGWPLGTVKTHIARGKDKLRNLLAPWNPTT
jgi:RNA polymerase sigma-70 factor (ECF subfamily)